MKTIAILLALFVAEHLFAQTVETSTITVVVENLKSEEGAVLFSLHTEDGFLKTTPKWNSRSEITNGKAVATFEDIPAGTYGITAFHDKNDNGQMDFEPGGLPKEDYGISNNKFNPYGPPTWSDARFEATGETIEMNIRLTR